MRPALLVVLAPALSLAPQDRPWKAEPDAVRAREELEQKFGTGGEVRYEAFGYIAHAAKADEELFERTNRFLATYARFAMEHLFTKPPAALKVVSFQQAEEFYKFAGRRGISGYYSNGQLVNNLNDGLGVCAHEMTHALNEADWGGFANGWFTEGVGALMENCLRRRDGTFIGIAFSHWRFPSLRGRIRDGRHQAFAEHMRQVRSDGNSYSQGRWILTYLFYKGRLKEFIREFRETRARDRSGITALEKVTGTKLDELEKAWVEWSRDLESEIATIRSEKLYPVLGILGRNRPDGLEVAAVTPGSTADRSGIKEGDVVLRFDRKPVPTMEALLKLLLERSDGDRVKIEYRRGEEDYSKTVTLDQFIDG